MVTTKMTKHTDSAESRVTNSLKQAAADFAATQLQNGMIVGLGSGSTATLAVTAIGRRVKDGLEIIGIPTSEKTAEQARGLNIQLSTLGEHSRVDVTIDGADEVELGTLNLIKGGGGNQLREKIVAMASSRLLIVVDEAKLVQQLGIRAKVPVEIAKFGWQATERQLTRLGLNPILRLDLEDKPYMTDGRNYILDCAIGAIRSPAELQRTLDSVVGVVEHGLFIDMASQVIVGAIDGVKLLNRIP